jgi:predicted DNA-binding protein
MDIRETATIIKLPANLMERLFAHAAVTGTTHSQIIQRLLENTKLEDAPTDVPELGYLTRQGRRPVHAMRAKKAVV